MSDRPSDPTASPARTDPPEVLRYEREKVKPSTGLWLLLAGVGGMAPVLLATALWAAGAAWAILTRDESPTIEQFVAVAAFVAAAVVAVVLVTLAFRRLRAEQMVFWARGRIRSDEWK